MDKKKATARKAKLSDTERHKRFVEAAREVGASDNPKDFDRAFMRVSPPPRAPKPK